MAELQEPQQREASAEGPASSDQGSKPSDSSETSGETHEKGASEAHTFPSPYEFNSREPTTLPRWWEKVHDEALVAKWRAEMLQYDRERIAFEWRPYPEDDDDFNYEEWRVKHWPPKPVTEAQLDYVFAELKHYASQVDEETGIHTLVPADVKDSLMRGVAVLESLPDEEKDWHPGSDG
ncbi:hypothetical protein C8Q80DRAFT_1276614 [Daedaleopsis nitida]|nr:hypothetical protein C8Q80DRAFT_1276614 [Daedaleopsis nitida]